MEATLKAMMRQKKRDSLLVVIRSKMESEMKVPPRSPNNPQRKMNKTFAFFILLFFLLSLSLFVLFCYFYFILRRQVATDPMDGVGSFSLLHFAW
jgi:cell division septal protein FtsQ